MTPLEVKHLENYCLKYDVDPAEIDTGIDYYENQEYLASLVHDVTKDPIKRLRQTMVVDFEPLPEEVMSPLQYYVAVHVYETAFEGKKPLPLVRNNLLRFSLRTMASTGFEGSFSLEDYVKHH